MAEVVLSVRTARKLLREIDWRIAFLRRNPQSEGPQKIEELYEVRNDLALQIAVHQRR